MATDEDDAPGWRAIDNALEPLYGAREPELHYAPEVPAILGGPDPIDGISVYRTAAFGREHWHFVTYGFSELYGKESPDPATSGYGFELSFRLARADEATPPGWAFNFLQNIGRYVFSTGNTFGPGHYMDLNSSIAVGSSSPIRAILFMRDPALPETIETPNGALRILQIVGVTTDELLTVKRWNSEKFFALFETRLPGGLTDLQRDSLLLDPQCAADVESGIASDGSSTGMLFPSVASFRHDSTGSRKEVIITFGANGVRDLLEVFSGRLPFERPLSVAAGDTLICFTPSTTAGWEVTPGEATLQIQATPQFASELMLTLRAQAGEYHFQSMPDLSIIVERTAITDRDGNVVEWVG